MKVRFEWDSQKEKINLRKHYVSFREAQSVFLDDEALLIPDPDHSHDEDRFVLLGLSHKIRLLLVCHCYRENDQLIRIFSARKADREETRVYLTKRG
jgi:uncharacterized DUF497 family protein